MYRPREVLIFSKWNLYILSKNVLTLAWGWPREEETYNYINTIQMLWCSTFIFLFIIYSITHSGMYNLKK